MTALAWGQGRRPGPAERTRVLLDDARAAPVEIFADITFQLLDRLPDKEKTAALEEVFHRAREAAQPLPLERAPSPSEVDASRRSPGNTDLAGILERAYKLRLDTLSLQCRVVEELLRIDPAAARRLFEQIAPPRVPAMDCTREFVPNAGVYIEILAAVAERGAFTEEERQKQAPWFLVERGARSVATSWELAAAAKALPRLARNEREAQILSAALAGALSLTDSDRAYTAVVRRGSLVGSFLQAARTLHALGAPDLLTPALRAYLVRQMSAERCLDNFPAPPGGFQSRDQTFRDWAYPMLALALDGILMGFNRKVENGAGIAPISTDEARPAKVEGEAKRSEFMNGPEFRDLENEIRGLGPLIIDAFSQSRLTAEWGFQARQALSKVQDWKGAPQQPGLQVFHEKCALLLRMVNMAPPGETRRIALSELVALFSDPAIPAKSPAEWLSELRLLLASPAPDILQALAASRLPALALYGRLKLE